MAFLVLPIFFTELNRETATNILETEFKRNVNVIVFFNASFYSFSEYIQSQIPPLFYSVSGEVIQGSDITG